MNNPFETSFISETVEKTPFADTPAQNFFREWCRINDSIIPEFIPRKVWEKGDNRIKLEKNDQGKQTLFLPEDLHLWEMMDIIKTIDADTLSRKPEKKKKGHKKYKNWGLFLKKPGYIFMNIYQLYKIIKGKQLQKISPVNFISMAYLFNTKKEGKIKSQMLLNLHKKIKQNWTNGFWAGMYIKKESQDLEKI